LERKTKAPDDDHNDAKLRHFISTGSGQQKISRYSLDWFGRRLRLLLPFYFKMQNFSNEEKLKQF
jgi:hypothetical protein